MNRTDLSKIFEDGEKYLTPLQLAAKQSVVSRGLPYYGILRKRFPQHFSSFLNMHKRTSQIDVDFGRSLSGFINFIEYLGVVPKLMISPTAGRLDHSKGYLRGNFAWQSRFDNLAELNSRKNCIINAVKNNSNIKTFNNLKHFANGLSQIKLTTDLAVSLGYSSKKSMRESLRFHYPNIKIITESKADKRAATASKTD